MTGTEHQPLFGRHDHRAMARELMSRPVRLLSLWGPPGVGKTRLARELADDVDPSVFVPLDDTADIEGLDATIRPMLAQRSRGWLILDNIEHLLDDEVAGPSVLERIEHWLDTTPSTVSFLVTSRRRLRLADEHPVPVDPLDPDSSRALFTSLVRRQRPDFDPEAEDAEVLDRLIAQLDGLPLAIELAAARWELLGTRGLLERMSAPLDVLARGASADPRHRTLRQAISGSWRLLAPTERRALQAMATFGGQFTATDAEALVGDRALESLEALRDSALIQIPSPGRFEVLSSIRAFAREETEPDDARELAEKHAAWLFERFPPGVERYPDGSWTSDLACAATHLVSCADPRMDHAVELLIQSAPGRYLSLVDKAIAERDSALLRVVRGQALRFAGRPEDARADIQAALQMPSSLSTRAKACLMSGALHHGVGDLDPAADAFSLARTHARDAGNRRVEAMATGNLALVASERNAFEHADECYGESLQAVRSVGDRRLEATVLYNRALLLSRLGELDAAIPSLRSALELAMDADALRLAPLCAMVLGVILLERGRLDEGRETLEQAWHHASRSPNTILRARVRAFQAVSLALHKDTADARRLFADAERMVAPLESKTANLRISWFWAVIDACEGRHEDAERRLRESTDKGRDHYVVARIVRAASPAARQGMEVGPDWFRLPGAERVDLGRHRSLGRMLRALVSVRDGPEGTIDVDGLFEAGWPGEQIAADSARNRVHVNLAKLRTLGLRDVIQRADGGYRLDPALPLNRAPDSV